jgi:hypothetical protein
MRPIVAARITGERQMHRNPNALKMGAILPGAMVAYAAAALAGPVTKADLTGKKICWSSGGSPTYYRNGDYHEDILGYGTWTLSGDRLTVVASHGHYTGTITKENETFHISGHVIFYRYSKDLEESGKYCE